MSNRRRSALLLLIEALPLCACVRSIGGKAGLFLNYFFMSDPTKYNNYGRQMTGFDSGIENSTFGHWRNPEYQQLNQDCDSHTCRVCQDEGLADYGFGFAACVDCSQGISEDFAKKVVSENKTFKSFVETYGCFCNGYPEYLSKYWQRCKAIVEKIDYLPY